MRLFSCLLLLLVLMPGGLAAQQRVALSSAGGTASSSTYAVRFTAGEPLSGVVAGSATYTMTTGFVETLTGEPGDFAAPSITAPTVPQGSPEAQPLNIEAEITDAGSGLGTVTLFYRRGGDTEFEQAAMSNAGGDTYAASIPAASITSRGAEFYISAVDNSANSARYPPAAAAYTPILVDVEAPGRESSLLSGTQQADYRLISVPMDLDAPTSATVLADLGAYDNTRWRLWALKDNYFDFEGEEQFSERTAGATFDPGSAFFILSADGGTFRTGAARSLSTVTPFTRTLHQGWNFVGNPFDFPIPVAALGLSNETAPNVQGYSAGWSAVTQLEPFRGYLIDAGSEEDDVTLSIDPDLGAVAASKTDDPAGTARVANADLTWSIRIDAHSGAYFDVENRLAAGPEASRAWDALDRPEPPVLGDYVSVYFPHHDWGLVHRQFEVDVRPEPAGGDVWDLEVATGTRRPVTLTFLGLEDVPARYAVELVDRRTGVTRDVRLNPSHTVVPAGIGEGWPLQILVGDDGYVRDQVDALDLLPTRHELDQNYPNPFNPSTSIRFGLAEASMVTLNVYNVLGQEVAVLVNGERREAGYHVTHWDARGDDGVDAASGLYLYRLRIAPTAGSDTGTSVMTRTMLLVK